MKKNLPGLWKAEKAILIGFGLALFILIVIGLLSYITIDRLIQTADWVNSTHDIQEDLIALRSHMADIESAARGYVITGLDEYLSPYHTGIAGAWGTYEKLNGAVRDPAQKERLARLPSLITARIAIARTIVEARKTRGFDAAVALVEKGGGKKVTDEIRSLLDEMQRAEAGLLSQRSAYVKRNARRTIIVLVAGVLLTVLIVGGAGYLFRGDMTRRRRAENELRESREQLQDFLDNANDLIHSVAPDGRFLYVNRKWRETLGYDEADLPRLKFQDIIHPDHRHLIEAIRQRVFAGKEIDEFETTFMTKDGQSVMLSGHVNARIENGQVVASRSIFRNITESKRTEEALQRSNEVLLRSVNELEQRTREISKLSEMGDLLQSCQKLEEAYKVIVEFVPQMLPSDNGALGAISSSRNLVEIVAEWGKKKPAERVFLPEDCWGLRRGRMHMVRDRGSALHCPHLGANMPESYFCIPLVAQGEAVGLLHLDFSGQADKSFDLTEPTKLRLIEAVVDRVALAMANLKLQEAMRQQSVRDPLTGLFNRRYLEESLERELRRAARNGRSLGILMIDLDFFKHFNDNFGHDAGDAMLREFSGVLAASIRGGDIACRYGGEEFALILPEACLETTHQRGQLLREKTKHLNVQHRGLSLGTITLSAGVVAFPQHGTTSETLLRAADEALYAAKKAGRDRVVVASIAPAQPG